MRRALLGGAALSALLTGLFAAQPLAHADIGLVNGGRGTAYVTIMGGYQHRDGSAAVAPAAPVGVDPLPGFDVDALAIVTPDEVSAKTRIQQGDRSASSTANATPNVTNAETGVQQTFGGDQGQAAGNATATSDAAVVVGGTELITGAIIGQTGAATAAVRNSGVQSEVSAQVTDPGNLATANAAAIGVIGPPGESSSAEAQASVSLNGFDLGLVALGAGNPSIAPASSDVTFFGRFGRFDGYGNGNK